MPENNRKPEIRQMQDNSAVVDNVQSFETKALRVVKPIREMFEDNKWKAIENKLQKV